MDLVQRAGELYATGEIHDALQAAQAACDRRPGDPEAWRLLGQIARHAGMPSASDLAFQRAAQLEGRQPPHRVSRERFTELVLEMAPADIHVHIEDLPAPEAIAAGTLPDALFHQDPGGGRVIYQLNIENRSRSEAELRDLVAEVLAGA